MTDIHSSANPTVLRNAASPEALEAALRASETAERLTKDDVQEAKAAEMRSQPFSSTAGAAEIAGPPSRTTQAVFQVSTAFASGGQDAVAACLELAQNAMRTNVEALSRLAGCHSWSEVMYVQSSVLQERYQQSLQCGEAVFRASTEAINKAAQAMHDTHQ